MLTKCNITTKILFVIDTQKNLYMYMKMVVTGGIFCHIWA